MNSIPAFACHKYRCDWQSMFHWKTNWQPVRRCVVALKSILASDPAPPICPTHWSYLLISEMLATIWCTIAYISNNIYLVINTVFLSQLWWLANNSKIITESPHKWPSTLSFTTSHTIIIIILIGLVRERCNSSALAMELRLSCIDPSTCSYYD